MHFQAFECQLAHIKPSAVKCPKGVWSKEASERFKTFLNNSESITGKVGASIGTSIILFYYFPNLDKLYFIHVDYVSGVLHYAQSAKCRQAGIDLFNWKTRTKH